MFWTLELTESLSDDLESLARKGVWVARALRSRRLGGSNGWSYGDHLPPFHLAYDHEPLSLAECPGGLRPPCPVGISGWLEAASDHPPSGQNHGPLLLAVNDPLLRHHVPIQGGSKLPSAVISGRCHGGSLSAVRGAGEHRLAGFGSCESS